MKRTCVAQILGLALVVGCKGQDTTKIVIEVWSDLAVPTQLDEIRIDVTGKTDKRSTSFALAATKTPDKTILPARLGVVPGGDSDTFDVVATGLLGTNEIVWQKARVSFVAGESLLLKLFLEASCVAKACDGNTTCSGGTCTRPIIVPTLPHFDPAAPLSPPDASIGVAPDDRQGSDDASADQPPDLALLDTVAAASDLVPDSTHGSGDAPPDQAPDFPLLDAVAPARDTSSDAYDGTDSGQATAVLSVVATPGSHACALLANHTVMCWGQNTKGQLGDGTTIDRLTPVVVAGITNATALGGGISNTCAVLADGTAKCWGGNTVGELGDGTTTDSATPVAVSGLTGAIALDGGNHHTCALLNDGTVRCWGLNAWGELGNGTIADSATPVGVPGVAGVKALATGSFHTCALLTDTSLACWGRNSYGELGNAAASVTSPAPAPAPVPGLTGVKSLSAGAGHTCVVLASGKAMCWGVNAFGQLGDGTTINSPTAVTVSGLTEVVGISAGYGDYATGVGHTCAVLADQTTRCWGANTFGQLGDGTTAARSTPTIYSSLTDASVPSAGFYFTCAVRNGGIAKCWGRNTSGQLGNGSASNDEPFPVTVRFQ